MALDALLRHENAMALLTIQPTAVDQAIARAMARKAHPPLERSAEILTLAADERVLLAVVKRELLIASLFFLAPRGKAEPAPYLAANAAVSAVVPHLLKRLVDPGRDGPSRSIRRGGRGNPAFRQTL